jgi:oligopeptide/dipeptide ABC transporter ATP-binding protein
LLRVEGLTVGFRVRGSELFAVRGVSFSLSRGETLCIVGESGSGKSTLSMAIAGLLPPNGRSAGQVVLGGRDLLRCSERELSDIRGRELGFVFQDPGRSLNPVMTIGRQIAEVLERHLGTNAPAARTQAAEFLAEVGVNDPELRVRQYPHELSGGLKQRVMIAIAIACRPDVLIADEPTTALDVTIQGQVLRLLQRLRRERGLSLILVTHDFGVVAAMADQVAVMYAGRIVEYAPVHELFHATRHPYTQALLEANPRRVLDESDIPDRLEPIPGTPPSALDPLSGCSFAPRCGKRYDACALPPPLEGWRAGHDVACWLSHHG